MVTDRLQPLIESQLDNAIGIKSLVYRDKKTGKYVPVSTADLAGMEDHDAIEVYERIPSNQAADSLLNRALDLPAKPVETVNADVALRITWAVTE